jgi:hypothetical protein
VRRPSPEDAPTTSSLPKKKHMCVTRASKAATEI